MKDIQASGGARSGPSVLEPPSVGNRAGEQCAAFDRVAKANVVLPGMGTAGPEVRRPVVNGRLTLLLESLLLPPRRVSVEEAELLQALAVVRHLVLVLATPLGESTSAVVDPLVAVDLPSDQFPSRVEEGHSGRISLHLVDGQDADTAVDELA